jgi:hypothetical protein
MNNYLLNPLNHFIIQHYQQYNGINAFFLLQIAALKQWKLVYGGDQKREREREGLMSRRRTL